MMITIKGFIGGKLIVWQHVSYVWYLFSDLY